MLIAHMRIIQQLTAASATHKATHIHTTPPWKELDHKSVFSFPITLGFNCSGLYNVYVCIVSEMCAN